MREMNPSLGTAVHMTVDWCFNNLLTWDRSGISPLSIPTCCKKQNAVFNTWNYSNMNITSSTCLTEALGEMRMTINSSLGHKKEAHLKTPTFLKFSFFIKKKCFTENPFRTYYLGASETAKQRGTCCKADNLSHRCNHMAEELTSTSCPLTSTQMPWHSSAYTHK